jgi:hypothetical protein
MKTEHERVPEWLLERLSAGDVPERQASELRARLEAHGEAARLTALADSNADVLAAYPPERIAPEIARRAAARSAREGARHRVRPAWAFATAAACAVGLFVVLSLQPPEHIGIKGLSPSLRVHRKTATGSEVLGAGAKVGKGDTLQIGYVSAGKHFGVIASIDARGTVTLHLPESPGVAAPLDPSGERTLGHAFELDDAPGFERFVFVSSDASFATAVVTAALASGKTLPPPFAMFEITLKKESP